MHTYTVASLCIYIVHFVQRMCKSGGLWLIIHMRSLHLLILGEKHL